MMPLFMTIVLVNVTFGSDELLWRVVLNNLIGTLQQCGETLSLLCLYSRFH